MIIQKLNGEINPQWVKERQGKLSASNIHKITKAARKKGEVSATLMTYAKELAAERLTGISLNNVNPNNPDIMRGNELEELALATYETKRRVMLAHPAAWLDHPKIDLSGATPDSWLDDGNLVQTKVPRQDNFVSAVADYMADEMDKILAPYKEQMTWECAVTGAKWNDLALFCNDMPDGKKMLIVRHEPSAEEIEKLEAQAIDFLAIVEKMFTTISELEY